MKDDLYLESLELIANPIVPPKDEPELWLSPHLDKRCTCGTDSAIKDAPEDAHSPFCDKEEGTISEGAD